MSDHPLSPIQRVTYLELLDLAEPAGEGERLPFPPDRGDPDRDLADPERDPERDREPDPDLDPAAPDRAEPEADPDLDLDLLLALASPPSESESSFLLFSRRFAFDVSTSLSSSADEYIGRSPPET